MPEVPYGAATDGAASVHDRAAAPASAARASKTLELSRTDFAALAAKQRQERAAALGAIVAMLAKAPGYRDMKISDIEWLVYPALIAGQYRIAETKPSETGPGGVAAILLYARVSPEVAARLDVTKTHPVKLAPEEWTSGAVLRTVLAMGRKDALSTLEGKFAAAVNTANAH